MCDVDGDTIMEDAKRTIMEEAKRPAYEERYTFWCRDKMPVLPLQCRLLSLESPFNNQKQLQDVMSCHPLVISFFKYRQSDEIAWISPFDAWTGSPVTSVAHIIMHDSDVLDKLKECFPNATFTFVGCHTTGLYLFAEDPRFRDSITSLSISRGLFQRIPSILENHCNVLTYLQLNIDSGTLPIPSTVFDSLQTCKFIEEFSIQLPNKLPQSSMKSFCAWLRVTKSLQHLYVATNSDERKSRRRAEFSDVVFALADNKDTPMTSLNLIGELVSCESLARLFDRRAHVRQIECDFDFNDKNYKVFDTVLLRSMEFTLLIHHSSDIVGQCKENRCLLRKFGNRCSTHDYNNWVNAATQASVNWFYVCLVLASVRSNRSIGFSIFPMIIGTIIKLIGNPIEFLIYMFHGQIPAPSISVSEFTQTKFAVSVIGLDDLSAMGAGKIKKRKKVD